MQFIENIFLLQCLKKEIATAKELDLRPLGKVIIFCDTQTNRQNLPIIYRSSSSILISILILIIIVHRYCPHDDNLCSGLSGRGKASLSWEKSNQPIQLRMPTGNFYFWALWLTELRRLKYFPGLVLLHGGERRQRGGSGRGDPGRTGGDEEGVNFEKEKPDK